MTTALEDMLRATLLRDGAIQMNCCDGKWCAVITYRNGRATNHCMGADQWLDDPVDALRAVLINEERESRDIVRRYAAATKIGAPAPSLTSDDEDLI